MATWLVVGAALVGAGATAQQSNLLVNFAAHIFLAGADLGTAGGDR